MGTLPQYEFDKSENALQALISQVPAIIATFKGPTYTVAAVNKLALEILGKSYDQVINKPLFESAPEMAGEIKEIFNEIYKTGEPFVDNEIPIQVKRTGESNTAYYNMILQPIRDFDNKIYGISAIGTEVTEIVKSRQQFETSDLLSRTILECTPDCLKVLDLEGRIQYMNYNGLCQMEIDDFSVFKNRNWSSLWGGQATLAKASFNLALKGNIAQFSAFCLTAKGKPKWWNVLVSPVRKVGGPVQQIVAVSRDITEQKIAQDALDKMASNLKLATDSANIGVWSLNIQTQKLEWSGLHKKMWGYHEKRTDLVYEDWYKLILPEDKQLVFIRVEDAKINHTFFEVEYRIKRANDNVIRWMKSVGQYYYNKSGEAETLTGISVDITEQKSFTDELEKKVEERTTELRIKNQTFEIAEKISKFGSYKWNITTGALQYSHNLFLLLDCEPDEFEPTYEKFISFIHPEDLAQVLKNGEETMKTGELVETPYRIISKTGKVKHLRSSGTFTKQNDEQILIGTVKDVTGDVEAAEELIRKNIELERMNTELASFSYIASHDLQEPLRKIQTFSKYITEAENFSEKTQGYFDRIIAASERMQNMIESLLNFSHTSSTELTLEPCNLNAITEEAIDNLQLSINEKQAIVDYEKLPTIDGSHIQLSQLFTNLIDNAIKYSRPAIQPHIKISASVVKGDRLIHLAADNNKAYHKIIFADNGIGFKKEYESKIFELFQRLHGRSEFSGTGIGLAIVKKIVSNHNGFVTAEGQKDIGATFSIYLPKG